MTHLVRLVDDDATESERVLLESARGDGPSPGASDRLLVALGAASALTAAAATAEAAAIGGTHAIGAGGVATGSAIAAGGTTTAAASVGVIGVVKFVAVGLLAGAVTTGAVAALSPAKHAGSEPSEAVAARQPVTELEAAVHAVRKPVTEPRSAASAPSPAANLPAARAATSAATVGPDVAAEVATLDRARRALGAGDARTALAALAEHQKNFKGGVLGPEAEVLRIEALVASGQRATAAQRARAFLAHDASSPHAARVRAALERATAGSNGAAASSESVKADRTATNASPSSAPTTTAPTNTGPNTAATSTGTSTASFPTTP